MRQRRLLLCRKNAVHKLQAILHPERHPHGPEVEGLHDFQYGDHSGRSSEPLHNHGLTGDVDIHNEQSAVGMVD